MEWAVKERALGIICAFLALYLALSLVSYDKWDPSFLTYTDSAPANMGGVAGAYLSDLLVSVAGLGSFILPLFLFVHGAKRFFSIERHRVHMAGAVLFLLGTSLLFALMYKSFSLKYGAGGLLGHLLASGSVMLMSIAGAYILALALMLTSLVLLSPMPVLRWIIYPRPVREKNRQLAASHQDISYADAGTLPEDEASGLEHSPAYDESAPLAASYEEDDEKYYAEVPGHPAGSSRGDILFVDHEADRVEVEPLAAEPELEPGAKASTRRRPDRYRLPGLDILKKYEPAGKPSRQEMLERASLLESKFEDFKVQGRVTQVHTGPVVTMCEYEPAPGVKLNKVVSLAEDLALALKAESVRIAPVPGKSAIGIEIPNEEREVVSLRDMLASEAFKKSKSRLTVAMGKDIFGHPVVADLARMPHLLVAGATGAGKSVFMNTLVMSLLYNCHHEEVKMLMIDPKLLELSTYDGIPHLISPVITSPKDASEMLRSMVFEMERRYRIIAEQGARNIDSYNASDPEERLPYIVIFIDELADLMLSSSAQVEDSIARLAQMARAAGIHLILATQRPSVDVITGVIKANFPARVAFQVTSRIDSRTIIDTQGAEQLIGRGDMLFMLPGVKLLRVHGALVTEDEVREAVRFCASQAKPDYTILRNIEDVQESARMEAEYSEDRDELYWKAVEFGEAMGEVSISSIQRKLKIGYNRAARIMDLMEEDNMVGPPKGAGKPRDFLGRQGMG